MKYDGSITLITKDESLHLHYLTQQLQSVVANKNEAYKNLTIQNGEMSTSQKKVIQEFYNEKKSILEEIKKIVLYNNIENFDPRFVLCPKCRMQIARKGKLYICNLCDYILDEERLLKIIKEHPHTQTPFQCPECEIDMVTKKDENNVLRCWCPRCNYYPTLDDMTEDEKNNREEEDDSGFEFAFG